MPSPGSSATARKPSATTHQRRTPGVRATAQPGLFTGIFADYCRQRFTEDPHLQSSALLSELTELGFQGSQRTFYRGLTRHWLLPPGRQRPQPRDQAPQESPGIPRLPAYTRQPTPVSPRSVTPPHRRGAHLLPEPARVRQPPHPHRRAHRAALLVLHKDQQPRRPRPAPHAHPRNRRGPARARPPHRHTPPPASPARSPPSTPPGRAAPSGPPPPAADAPRAAASTSPSPFTCPPTKRSAPVTASGSATPASPSSTSPPAQRSSPPSTKPTGSCAATPRSN